MQYSVVYNIAGSPPGKQEVAVQVTGARLCGFDPNGVMFCVNGISVNADGITSLSLLDGSNLSIGATTGSKIGEDAASKMGFWGLTPVVQPTALADVSGGATVDSQARTALNSLLAKLRTIGIIAT